MRLLAQVDSTDYNDDPSDWFKPSENETSRLGIIMGTQISAIYGPAIPNSKALFGLLGGGYGRYNFKRGYSIQQALQVSFRGGNFQSDPGAIHSIKLLYLDAPLIIFKKLGKNSKQQLGFGLQYSNLLNSSMYLDSKSFPTGESPKLDKNDWSSIIAYQYQFEYFALQIASKIGNRNLNLGYDWPDFAKPLNNKGSLHNFALELNIIF
jgi:hypothetical protein